DGVERPKCDTAATQRLEPGRIARRAACPQRGLDILLRGAPKILVAQSCGRHSRPKKLEEEIAVDPARCDVERSVVEHHRRLSDDLGAADASLRPREGDTPSVAYEVNGAALEARDPGEDQSFHRRLARVDHDPA